MNYLKILNLNKEPFANTPDPDIFYQLPRQHLGCLQRLELSIRLQRGLNVVVGEVGAGKTTICRQLIRRLATDDEFETHLIMDPGFSGSSEFLAAVAGMFLGTSGIDEETPDLAVKESIKQYLFKQSVERGRTVVLIIDEGQKMPGFGLEILREFLNYETNEHKLLQIVIFAQREFDQALKFRPNFVDRINVYEHLGPLNFRETRALVRYRLDVSSNTAATLQLFTTGALWVIYRAGRGYPRKIVSLCHQCVLSLIVKDRQRVDYWLARACARRLAANQPGQQSTRSVRPGLAWAALVVIVSALVLGLARSPVPEMVKDRVVNLVEAVRMIRIGSADQEPGTSVSVAAVSPQPAQPAEPETTAVPAPADDSTTSDPSRAQISSTEAKPTESGTEKGPVPADTPFAEWASLPADWPGAETAPPDQAAASPAQAGPDKDLGQVAVQPKESLSRFCWLVYGSYDQEYLNAMMEANPQLQDPNRIKIGEKLRFPDLAQNRDPLAEAGYWIRLGQSKTLDQALDVVRAQGDAWPELRVVAYKSTGPGLEFAVIYRTSFPDAISARSALGRLSLFQTAQAAVVGTRPGQREFFTDPEGR